MIWYDLIKLIVDLLPLIYHLLPSFNFCGIKNECLRKTLV